MPLSKEGRVVVPAHIRRALHVGPGDRLRWILDGDTVRVESASQLLAAVRANNAAQVREGSAEELDASRADNAARDAAKAERARRDSSGETRTESQIEASLLRQLGLGE